MEDISAANLKGESVGLIVEEALSRKEKFSALWGLLRSKDSLLFQRFKSKWLKEGDVNSRYFHVCVKSMGSLKRVSALRVGDAWVEDVAGIRDAVTSFLTSHFSEAVLSLPTLDGIAFPSLSALQVSGLSGQFSREEIEIVLSCDGNKSPRPDGFNFAFIKAFWPFIKDEVGILFDEFYSNGTLQKSFSSYFLGLIPKG